jgi:hypothetical protein
MVTTPTGPAAVAAAAFAAATDEQYQLANVH